MLWLALTALLPQRASAAEPAIFELRNLAAGTCLNVEGGSSALNTNTHQWHCDARNPANLWRPSPGELAAGAALAVSSGPTVAAPPSTAEAEFSWNIARRRGGSLTPPAALRCDAPQAATRQAHCVLTTSGSAVERVTRAVPRAGACVMPPLTLAPGERELAPGTSEAQSACGERVCAPCVTGANGQPVGSCPCGQLPFYPWER